MILMVMSCIKAGLVRRHYDVVNEIRALLTSAGVETPAEVVLAPELRVDLVAKKFEMLRSHTLLLLGLILLQRHKKIEDK